jgi:hypothetical protein
MGVWKRRVTDTGPRKVLEFFMKSQFMGRKFMFGVEAEQGEQLAQFVNWRLNWERYVNMILNRVLPEITQEERLSCFFQQDSAAAHTAGNSVAAASDVFNGTVTSRSVIFVSVVAWKTASTEEIPTYYVNLEKILGMKYPGFPKQKYNVWTRESSRAASYVYEHRGNILNASSGREILSLSLFSSLVPRSQYLGFRKRARAARSTAALHAALIQNNSPLYLRLKLCNGTECCKKLTTYN